MDIIPMDDKLHPIGTLMYEDSTMPGSGADWRPHRTIWRVKSHELCAPHPKASARLACAIELVRQEDIQPISSTH